MLVTSDRHVAGNRVGVMFRSLVITGAEVLLQPDIEADKKIAAAHLLNFQLRGSGPPVAPGDGERGPSKAADDRLERYLDCEVKMRRDERAASVDHFLAIGLEGIGGVIQFDAEQNLEEKIGEAIEEQFDFGIIDH